MKEENILYILTAVTFVSIALTLVFSRIFFIVNLSIYILYSSYFYFGLYYQGSEGRSLGWLLSNLFFTGLHLIIVVIYLIIRFIKLMR
jgi:hypothetical protein